MKPSLVRTSLLLAALIVAQAARANPCAAPYASGMGGTGIDGSGIGGTGGVADTGMGGTGIDGSGMGGTGATAANGMGGTGATAANGMGGTGAPASGGMGGTGRSADNSGVGGTGVVGVITGFASICVNGVEIHYEASTPVFQDGQASSPKSLAIGQWVSVEAAGHGTSLQARAISLNSALVGPVSRVAADGKSFEALGQTVRIDNAGTPVSLPPLAAPKPGQMVRVSGPRDAAGVVHATHLEAVAPDTPLSVTGPLSRGADGAERIGALKVSGVDAAVQGVEVRVRGLLRDGAMRAERVDVEPDLRFSDKVDRLLLQGLAQRPETAKQISLGYVRIEVPGAQDVAGKADQWVRVEAERDRDGGIESRRLIEDRGHDDVERPARSAREHERDREKRDAGREHRPERPEREKPEIEKPEIEKPEIEKPEIEKPEIEKPEIEKPEIEKPELEKPEIEKPEYEKPEYEKPEYEKPEFERH